MPAAKNQPILVMHDDVAQRIRTALSADYVFQSVTTTEGGPSKFTIRNDAGQRLRITIAEVGERKVRGS